MSDQKLTKEQVSFFNTFGFLAFPGLLADRIDEIIREFEDIFKKRGGGHFGKPGLSGLRLDHDERDGEQCQPDRDRH